MPDRLYAWAMLTLLCGQFACFFLAVRCVFAKTTPGSNPSYRYKYLLFGGIGFLLFGINCIIAAPWVSEYNLVRFGGVGLYLLGMALLQLGLNVRRKVLCSNTQSQAQALLNQPKSKKES